MKNSKWHNIIRKRLMSYRKECLKCLYTEKGYEWGCLDLENKQKTVTLLNKILKRIPEEAWPSKTEFGDEYIIASNNWRIKLMWEDYRRHADLKFRNDDHTAWVVEHSRDKGRFVDYDIGGS